MFSIPAAGLAQSLMAVTISMHPATAHHYTVRSGDTLSAIAHHEYGKTADWPAIWWANRHQISNPNLISAGARLRLPGSDKVTAVLDRAARAAAAATAPAATVSSPSSVSSAVSTTAPTVTAVTLSLPGSRSRAPAEIRFGLEIWCRLAHQIAGQSAVLPYS